MSNEIYKCIEPTETLTKDRDYVSFGKQGNCIIVLNDHGRETPVRVDRFELIDKHIQSNAIPEFEDIVTDSPHDLCSDIHEKFRPTSKKPTKIYKMCRRCGRVY